MMVLSDSLGFQCYVADVDFHVHHDVAEDEVLESEEVMECVDKTQAVFYMYKMLECDVRISSSCSFLYVYYSPVFEATGVNLQ